MLANHYVRSGPGPVAYVDESYHVAYDGRPRFYVMAAVIVAATDRDDLRTELDRCVPGGWWHTSEVLQEGNGAATTKQLLDALRYPDEACVVVHNTVVGADDHDGRVARGRALSTLLSALTHPPEDTHEAVRLAVLEEQRVNRINNADRATRSQLLASGAIDQSLAMACVSPAVEHLLWLPDVVCSAYRQHVVGRRSDLFDVISSLTTVIMLP